MLQACEKKWIVASTIITKLEIEGAASEFRHQELVNSVGRCCRERQRNISGQDWIILIAFSERGAWQHKTGFKNNFAVAVSR